MIIGTCSLCGGPVSLPDVWYGVVPPIATCDKCGATRADHGPLIKMKPSPGMSITDMVTLAKDDNNTVSVKL